MKAFRVQAAAVLRALADRINPPQPAVVLPTLFRPGSAGPQTLIAREMVLRQHLHHALHRFAPEQKPAEA